MSLCSKCGLPKVVFTTSPAQARDRHSYPNVCVQEAIEPALLNESKFDLRIYVLVESVLPLRAHICRSAMLRKCMEQYKPLNAGDRMHKYSFLTNTSINKKVSPFGDMSWQIRT